MKANVNLEISKEDLNDELRHLISEIASDEIRRMVREESDQMIKEEIKRIVSPIVDSYLESAQVGRENISYHSNDISRRHVDEYIKRLIVSYLDEPVYLYSRDSSELSKRYWKASDKNDKTRAERWVNEKARSFVDNELFRKIEIRIEEVVKSLIPSEEEIHEIIKREVVAKFS
ncbi:hypothetical protein HYI36_05045 [Bacillus sp. Gen3]|nr:hypothetical protein [Bacillus sp. Gen3]